MPSTFINPVVNPDRQLGVNAFVETAPIRQWPASADDSTEEIDVVIRAIYKQVLGNAYVMESERQQIPESQFRRGEVSVVEFIRQIALSELYRSRFFDNGPRNRFIELNFKHFLGRAPINRAEIAQHSAILDKGGYEAEIDSYLNGYEYLQAFGTDTVPYYRGYKTEGSDSLVGFTHMFSLLRGASSSDKNVTQNNPARLSQQLFANHASSVVSPSGAVNRQGCSAGRSVDEIIRTAIAQQSTVATAKAQSADKPASAPLPLAGLDESDLSAQSQEQAELIQQLEAQLSELRSLSTMGAAMLRSSQQSQAAGDQNSALASVQFTGLKQQVYEQSQTIDRLRGELMSARSLANIAEFKLNRWRARSF